MSALPKYTPDEIDAIAKMWVDGLPGTVVANKASAMLNRPLTRSMVNGLMWRLGYKRGGGQKSICTKQTRPEPHVSVTPLVDMDEPERVGVMWPELHAHHCKWPLRGFGADTVFCGHPQNFKSPYCTEHAVKAINPELTAKLKSGDRYILNSRRFA